jgi:transcriptional regulator with XRE-family HTH domain
VANEFGEYLRILRGRVSPAQVGLPDTQRRRVPGLRRGELSQLVGLSAEYYMRLEQGRADRPSEQVLRALSRALQLTPAEETHLLDLARNPRAVVAAEAKPLRTGLGHVVDAITGTPAMIMSPALTVLHWNELAEVLIADFSRLQPRERNMARQIFLNADSRKVHGDWDQAAEDTVGMLRLAGRRPPVEPEVLQLVDELLANSETFARLWLTHCVHEKTSGPKVFVHPSYGRIDLHYDTFHVAGNDGKMLVIYSVSPGSKDEATMHRLVDSLPRRGIQATLAAVGSPGRAS